jgi:predicted dinucleotide-binding enzyme
VVASLAPGARVVKALNTLLAGNLSADPREAGGRRVLFMSGDDAPAKSEVTKVLDRIGFATIDLGSLSIGGALQQFPGGPLPVHNLIKLG